MNVPEKDFAESMDANMNEEMHDEDDQFQPGQDFFSQSPSNEKFAHNYDFSKWNVQLQKAAENGPTFVVQVYRNILAIYPTSVKYWIKFIDFEQSYQKPEHILELFSQAISNSQNVDIMMKNLSFRIDYNLNSLSNDVLVPTIKDLYESSLEKAGMLPHSSTLWIQYINFLKSLPSTTPNEIKTLFRRALCVPQVNLESIWAQYQDFISTNNELSISDAEKEQYAIILRFSKSLFGTINSLEFDVIPPSHGASYQFTQVKIWYSWIELEKKNQLNLPSSDLNHRISSIFNLCLESLYYYPEAYHWYAQWNIEIGNHSIAQQIYQRGRDRMPWNLMMRFLIINFYEEQDDIHSAESEYQVLIKDFSDYPITWVQYMFFSRRFRGIQAARRVFYYGRRLSTCTYHLYVAASQIEYFVNKEERVARSILELGYSLFHQQPVFLNQYVIFLFHMNEESYMRVLFEKILSSLPASQAFSMWNKFIQFESLNGNLEAVSLLEKRRSQKYPGYDPSGILTALERKKYMDLWPCSSAELLSFSNDFKPDQIENKENQDEIIGTTSSMMHSYIMPDLTKLHIFTKESPLSIMTAKLEEFIASMLIQWNGCLLNTDALIEMILSNKLKVDLMPVQNKSDTSDTQESFNQIKSKEAAFHDVYRRRLKKITKMELRPS